jgi:predicted O-methyltransferase YrrM
VNSYRANLRQKYPDCWQWISLARRIPGQLTEQEANLLFQLVRTRAPSIDPVIVELGACRGKTSLLLAAGLCGKTRPRLFSIPRAADAGAELDQQALHRILHRCHLGHFVDTSAGNSREASANWKDCIDILFINAPEDDDALHNDLLLWPPLVKMGGIVVLRGVSPENLQSPLYSDLRQVGNLAFAVKQRASSLTTAIPAAPGDATELATARLQDYVRRAAKEFAESRHAVRALHRSWSWRLTAPLRWGVDTLHTIFGLLTSFGHGSPKARIVGLAQWMLFGRQVRASGLLDEHYYPGNYPDVVWARTSPLLHFLVCGASEGKNPSQLFDVHYYLRCYPDVAHSGINPLVHYLRNGAYEGRDPHPYFDSSFYLERNPDVREGRLNPLAHYLAPGIAEGRDPNPWFDTSEYLEQNPDVAIFGLNPLTHYLCSR